MENKLKIFEQEYLGARSKLEDLVEELHRLVEGQLGKAKIVTAFPVSSRMKDFASVKEKLISRRVHVKKSILELQDLVGIRIIALYQSDTKAIGSLLQSLFPDLKKVFPRTKAGNGQFGYSSIHYLGIIPISWKELVHLEGFVGLRFEIQVRTLSEHVWAECSSSLNYKARENIPPIIERPLNRLAALLEIVDSEMENIKSSHEKYLDSVSNLAIENLLREDLNGDTLRLLMKKVFPDQEHLLDEKYSHLNVIVEKDYNILNMAHLFTVIEKYKVDFSNLPENPSHDKSLTMILEAYRKNDYT